MRPTVAMLMTLATAVGCGNGPARVGGQPSWRKQAPDAGVAIVATGPIELRPSAPGVRLYNEALRTPPPSSPLGDAVIAEIVALTAHTPATAPVADGRLFAAAAELARVVPAEGVVPYPLVEFALQHHGIIEPSPHLLVVWGVVDSPAELVEQLRPRLLEVLADGGITRVGVGAATRPDGDVLVVALQASHVDTQPIPRALAVDATTPIRGRILGSFRDPEVFVTRPDGVVDRVALREGAAGEITSEVRCGGRAGRHQVEITASDQTGSTVLANFPVWCGATPPDRHTAAVTIDDAAPVTTASDAEARMFQLVNQDRASANLPPLAPDPRLADVARAHSREMRVTGVVGHVSTITGSAADRLRVAGVRTGLVLENIARAYGVGEAEAGLMNSPGHRANLLAAGATHLGIGIELGEAVSGRRELFVTQVFIRVPPQVELAGALAEVRTRLRGARPFSDDAGLDRIATTYATALAAGTPHAEASKRAGRDLDQVARRFVRVASMVTAVTDMAAFDPETMFGDGMIFSHVGVGVAQGDHPELGPGAVHVVVLLGMKR